uniref:Uncharacterized protein n=1 Tax=Anopheles christyi TaxID=43041 RepID=A0A182KDG2_9DIPT
MKPVAIFACLIALIFTLQNAHCEIYYNYNYNNTYNTSLNYQQLVLMHIPTQPIPVDRTKSSRSVVLPVQRLAQILMMYQNHVLQIVFEDASASRDSSESLNMANVSRSMKSTLHFLLLALLIVAVIADGEKCGGENEY